jgi:hypothetical protein
MRDCHKTLYFSRGSAARIIFLIDFSATQLSSRHRTLSIGRCVGRVPELKVATSARCHAVLWSDRINPIVNSALAMI